MMLIGQPSTAGSYQDTSNHFGSLIVRCRPFEEVLQDVRLIMTVRKPADTAMPYVPPGIGKTSRVVALRALFETRESKMLTQDRSIVWPEKAQNVTSNRWQFSTQSRRASDSRFD